MGCIIKEEIVLKENRLGIFEWWGNQCKMEKRKVKRTYKKMEEK